MSENTELFANDITERVIVEGDPRNAGQGRIVIERSQDLEPFIEAAKVSQAETPYWRPFAGRDIAHVAEIPNIIVEKWRQEGFNIFDPSPEVQRELRRRLDDPDNKWMKLLDVKLASTTRGR